MSRLFIATQTVTMSLRCRDVLRKNGFNAWVEKRTSLAHGGCGYGVIVNGKKEDILNTLAQSDIKVLKVYEL